MPFNSRPYRFVESTHVTMVFLQLSSLKTNIAPWKMVLKRLRSFKEGPLSDTMLTRWWFQRFFLPLLREMIQFDEHIFQMGWFNHQLVKLQAAAWGYKPGDRLQRDRRVSFTMRCHVAGEETKSTRGVTSLKQWMAGTCKNQTCLQRKNHLPTEPLWLWVHQC